MLGFCNCLKTMTKTEHASTDKLDDLGHLEGGEPLVGLLTTLRKWGMLA